MRNLFLTRLRLTPAMVGAMCLKAAIQDGAVAHHSGRGDDYSGRQAQRFAKVCGSIPVNGVHFGQCWLIKESVGYRLIVDNIPGFDHRIADIDAISLLKSSFTMGG